MRKINKVGVCCIVLALEEQDPPLKFRTMTYKSFSSLEREPALVKLGEVVLNNLLVTERAVEYCGINGHNYRLSSNVFPLMTYDKARLDFSELPQRKAIEEALLEIKRTKEKYNVRLSSHPDQFNVLASDNLDAVDRTIKELNFHGWFMDSVGCSTDRNSPINIHVNRSAKTDTERATVRDLFYENFSKLDVCVRSRLVLENDDKPAGWTVHNLFNYFEEPEIPITFDYLHHKCNPGTERYWMDEAPSMFLASESWRDLPGKPIPLFHYSESIPGDKNPRKHADYASTLPDTYDRVIDLDFEFKMKEKSFEKLLCKKTNTEQMTVG